MAEFRPLIVSVSLLLAVPGWLLAEPAATAPATAPAAVPAAPAPPADPAAVKTIAEIIGAYPTLASYEHIELNTATEQTVAQAEGRSEPATRQYVAFARAKAGENPRLAVVFEDALAILSDGTTMAVHDPAHSEYAEFPAPADLAALTATLQREAKFAPPPILRLLMGERVAPDNPRSPFSPASARAVRPWTGGGAPAGGVLVTGAYGPILPNEPAVQFVWHAAPISDHGPLLFRTFEEDLTAAMNARMESESESRGQAARQSADTLGPLRLKKLVAKIAYENVRANHEIDPARFTLSPEAVRTARKVGRLTRVLPTRFLDHTAGGTDVTKLLPRDAEGRPLSMGPAEGRFRYLLLWTPGSVPSEALTKAFKVFEEAAAELKDLPVDFDAWSVVMDARVPAEVYRREGDQAAAGTRFAGKMPLGVRLAREPDAAEALVLQPALILIDPKGIIRSIDTAWVFRSQAGETITAGQLREKIEPLLKPAAPAARP
ncbi:MAG: hypothetical protein IBJ11_07345 [Phycisphaerales bacterium]|nr:hypothetical protein [Phycisphaerales bacterium]